MLFCRNSSTKPEDRGNHSYRLVFLFPDCQMSLRHPSNLKPPYGNFHTNQPFGRFASAQIGMKVCRQTAAFLVELY